MKITIAHDLPAIPAGEYQTDDGADVAITLDLTLASATPPGDPPPTSDPGTSPPSTDTTTALVTHALVELSGKSQADVPVSFGQVFKAGDVPQGATLAATLDGAPVPLQVDAKATHADGSLRHAVLTARVANLEANAQPALALAVGAAPAASAPVSLADLLATGYDATVSITCNGVVYTASARALLQAAAGAAPWNPQCSLWLSGPLASEWVVNGPLTAPDGTTIGLCAYFAVRAYAGADGTVGKVRTDVIVENTDAYAPKIQPQYTAALTAGSASYASAELTHYAACRWHQVLWWNDQQPDAYVRQDTQYLEASLAVSRYMPLTPDESFLATLRQACDPLTIGDQTQTMGNQGAQAAIGPLPRWTSVYLIDPDIRAYRWMLANTDALGAYSIHYRDPATGFPVSIQKHPYATIIDGAYAAQAAKYSSATAAKYKADLLYGGASAPAAAGLTTANNPNLWDDAHQPATSYVPYLVTGDYYYLSELAFGASHNELWSNESYRGFDKGLIDRSHGQIRGKAWALREMADAAWLLPDSYPLKAEFNADVLNSLADWNAKYTNNAKASPLGLLNDGTAPYSLNGGTHNAMAPWQHNFLTWSAGHAAELGFAGAAEFRNWLAKFEIALMTDWQSDPTHGYCWLEASAYNLQVKDTAGNWLPSFAACYAATFPTLVGLVCNSPAMVAAMGKLEGKSWQAAELYGYPYSPVGFPANLQIGLAAAADSGLPNAHEAWKLFESRSVKPAAGKDGYNDYPNFAVIPRSVAT